MLATQPNDDIADDGAGTLPAGTPLAGGQFTIERFLVRGGFGITYLARDTMDRQVIIKECFPASLSHRFGLAVIPNDPDQSAELRHLTDCFAREARIMGALQHPSIPTVHHLFRENHTQYIIATYVDGADLLTTLLTDPKRLTQKVVRDLLVSALHTVAFLHDNNVLHRDISPENLILGDDTKLSLIDFGNACDRHDPTPMLSHKRSFTAPECLAADPACDLRSDLYALAATFHQLITGHPPPDARNRLAQNDDSYRPLAKTRCDYDTNFLAAIDDALSLDPNLRPASADDWHARIAGMTLATPPKPRAKDPKVSRVISTLVAEVNVAVAQPTALPQSQPPQKTAPKQLVDVYGDPIEDINAWALAQNQTSPPPPTPFAIKSALRHAFRRLLGTLPPPPNTLTRQDWRNP